MVNKDGNVPQYMEENIMPERNEKKAKKVRREKTTKELVIRTIIAGVLSAALIGVFLYYEHSIPKNSISSEEADDPDLKAYAKAHGMSADEVLEMQSRTQKEPAVTGGVITPETMSDNELAEKPSDITGWSLLDKKNAGLQLFDGSDSDRDGLTDKEEIETYKTDPLKASTAGDMYTDYYKVNNNMDPTKTYEFKGEQVHAGNSCSNVMLVSTTAASLQNTTVVKTDNSDYYIKGHSIIEAYKIAHFEGTATIDLTQTLSGNSMKNIEVFDGAYTDKKLDYKKDGNNIIIQGHGVPINVVIVTKRNTVNALVTDKNGYTKYKEKAETSEDAFCYDFVFFNIFGNKPKIYYVSSGDDATDKKMLDGMIQEADDMSDGAMFRFMHRDYDIGYKICEKVTPTKLAKIRKTIKGLPFASDWETTTTPGISYCDYKKETDTVHFVVDNFDVNSDELPFCNFGSYINNGGNCAGIAEYTALLYNNGEVPSSGSFTTWGGQNITWNIADDINNATLLDRGLHDYKTASFVSDHSGLNEYGNSNNVLIQDSLTTGEQQFVNMIGNYWTAMNNTIYAPNYACAAGTHSEAYNYDKLTNKMMEYLDNGKIFSCVMYVTNKVTLNQAQITNDYSKVDSGWHAVNIVGYECYKDDPDTICFFVYDSNQNGYTLPLVVKKDSDGYISYEYNNTPIASNCGYSSYSSSDPSYALQYALIAYDDKFNILNYMQ